MKFSREILLVCVALGLTLSGGFSQDEAPQDLQVGAATAGQDPLPGETTNQEPAPQPQEDLSAGIGVVVRLNRNNGEIEIKKVLEDGAADRAGLRVGDVILKIDDFEVTGQDVDISVRHIRGAPGTKVVLTVRLLDETEPTEVSVVREVLDPKLIEKVKAGE